MDDVKHALAFFHILVVAIDMITEDSRVLIARQKVMALIGAIRLGVNARTKLLSGLVVSLQGFWLLGCWAFSTRMDGLCWIQLTPIPSLTLFRPLRTPLL